MKLKTLVSVVTTSLLVLSTASTLAQAAAMYEWRYYRPSNTGIQGDFNEALWIGPDRNPWIAGYDASFEEGGISQFIFPENRWVNYSNVDIPEIGHPFQDAVSRIADIDVDSRGKLWMATGAGALYLDPAKGARTIRRFGSHNSPIPDGWKRSVEVAPDGTVWFSAYSTFWGSGGVSRYNPRSGQWQVFPQFDSAKLAIQPRPGGGYYVWTMDVQEASRWDSTTQTWTNLPVANGNPSFLPGNSATDSAGNTWMYKWTDATLFTMQFDLRRPDGTWVNTPRAPFDTQFNGANAVRALGPGRALVVDGGGEVWYFDGTAWTSKGHWEQTTYSYDVDMDSLGNIWACGAGGAARRDAVTGQWQRYRITNTSQFDFFNNDLTVRADGTMYATANAGPGAGGMVKFDGQRWTGFNQLHYGLGFDWPFNGDNSSRVYLRPSNGQVVVNPMFSFLHSWNGTGWTDMQFERDSASDMIEDSTGRLWAATNGVLSIYNGVSWSQVSDQGGVKLRKDPTRPSTVWSMSETAIYRTNGVTDFIRTIEDFPELSPQSDQFKGFAVDAQGMVWLGANTINLPDNSALFKINPATGAYQVWRFQDGWPFPGQYVMPLAATPDGKIWMQYDSDFGVDQRGLVAFDGTNVTVFPAPPGGEPQWGGLPHAGITDLEVRIIPEGYELWMSCASRGIAVLRVRTDNR